MYSEKRAKDSHVGKGRGRVMLGRGAVVHRRPLMIYLSRRRGPWRRIRMLIPTAQTGKRQYVWMIHRRIRCMSAHDTAHESPFVSCLSGPAG